MSARATRITSPFTLIANPDIALEAARRLSSAQLPRRASALDGMKGKPVDSDVARYDEQVEQGIVT